jgi:hypothetical protein
VSRNPFAFLDSESKDRTLLLLLLSILHKQGDTITLDLADLTSIEDGSSFHKYPSDTGTSLVLRFARKGAEAYFLPAEDATSTTKSSSRLRSMVPSRSVPAEESSPARHAIHDDVDLALREEEMASRAESAQRERMRKARAEAGALPWTTRQ